MMRLCIVCAQFFKIFHFKSLIMARKTQMKTLEEREIAALKREKRKQRSPLARVFIEFSREAIDRTQYPVIVECWDHKNYGKGKRIWMKSFTEKERKKLHNIYPRLYRWCLVKGTPEWTRMTMETYQFIQKACGVFASMR